MSVLLAYVPLNKEFYINMQKTYGLFNRSKYRNTDVMTVTRKFSTREAARDAKRSYVRPENIGIVNLITGVIVR